MVFLTTVLIMEIGFSVSHCTKGSRPCTTPLNPPLGRGEEDLDPAPTPYQGEGWGGVMQGVSSLLRLTFYIENYCVPRDS